jgi:thiol-disulfide isomerase/thioredoxin
LAVGVVVLVVAALVGFYFARPKSSDTGGITSGRAPAAAPSSVVAALTRIPLSTYNSVGTGGEGDPFVETKDQPSLTANGLPRVVYVGAEYCPYCAIMRWSVVAALGRFGTFTGLKESSSSADFAPIPTFSFLGTTYASRYVSFSAYETEDRNGTTLQSLPSDVSKLYATYDGTGETPTKFTGGSYAGIPFLDVANDHVSSGDPSFLAPSATAPPVSALAGGGPGMLGIAEAIADPTGVVGRAIDARAFDIEANYITAAICLSDGGKPSSVCASSGVKAAEKVIAAAKKIS